MSSYHQTPARRGSFASRPTSLYGSSTNLGLIGYSGMSQSSPYLNSPVSNYSPSYSTYGGTSSGYGGILVPSVPPALSSPSLYSALLQGLTSSRSSSPSYTKRSSYSPRYNSPTSSRYPSRSSSFNRHTPYTSSSKISSTSSLANSEGYESGTEKSVGASVDSDSIVDKKEVDPSSENGEIDYKKLYEETKAENERLREKLRDTEEDLALAKSQAEKNAILHKNSLSEVEKRERRAMERKLSEMEEELKQLEQLKCENQRLKDENGALIRVISKLSK